MTNNPIRNDLANQQGESIELFALNLNNIVRLRTSAHGCSMRSPSATGPSLFILQPGPLKLRVKYLTLTPIVDCMPEVEVSPGAGVATTCPVGRSVIGLKLKYSS